MACDDLKRKNEKLHDEIDEIHNEMLTLCNSLVETAEERDALSKALAVLGTSRSGEHRRSVPVQPVTEQYEMLERISTLEMVLGQFGEEQLTLT
jgi:uncharacterized coiled-coil DUF342 family protein